MRKNERSNVSNITVANNQKIPVHSRGEVKLPVNSQNGTKTLLMKNVLYIPNLSTNLMSVGTITDNGYKVIFEGDKCTVMNAKNEALIYATKTPNKIYKLDTDPNASLNLGERETVTGLKCTTEKKVPVSSASIEIWHRRLAHLNSAYLIQLKSRAATGIDFPSKSQLPKCDGCLFGKMVRKPYPSSGSRADDILELVHSDVCELPELSLSGAKYIITFLDDHSRKAFVYFAKSKDQVTRTFTVFQKFVENQMNKKIKRLRSDNGGEYIPNELKCMLEDSGIHKQTTIPYNAPSNGRAERLNRILLEKVRCMSIDAKLPNVFWAEAMATATYISNRSPKCALDGKTPEEVWTGQKPNLAHVRIFGCRAVSHIPAVNRNKLQPTAKECLFLGYCTDKKGYRLWDKKNNKVITTTLRDVEFFESEKNAASLQPKTFELNFDSNHECLSEDENQNNVNDEQAEEIRENNHIDGNSSHSETEEQPDEKSGDEDFPTKLRRSMRPKKKPANLDEFVLYTCVADTSDPKTITQALNGPNAEDWWKAMQREMGSIAKAGTWELCDLPADVPEDQVVRCKWVFKRKEDEVENTTRFKARLVAKGYSQIQGINYDDTYSPVVRFTSIRVLFAFAARADLEVYHYDIETAFLHGDLDTIVYMFQPEGFISEDTKRKVCLLKKALHGLKQGSRAWNRRIDAIFKAELKFSQSQYDSCVYFCIIDNVLIIIAIFVDDILIFTKYLNVATQIGKKLSEFFPVKNLGLARKFLGLHIYRNKEKGIYQLDQTNYIKSVIRSFKMQDCHPKDTPMQVGSKLSSERSPDAPEKDVPYQSAIGSLMYVYQATRPDLGYSISTLSRYNNCYTQVHWTAVKRVLKYLQGTANICLTFSKHTDPSLVGYCDASWAPNPDDPRSVTGYIFTFMGGAVSWNSKRQSTVALSSTQAEYLSLGSASQEALWLRHFALELGLLEKGPIDIYCDNKGAIDLAKNAQFSSRTRHISARHHLIKQYCESKKLKVHHLPSEQMIADALTKATSASKLQEFMESVGLIG